MPWPKQTFRLGNRTYSHKNYLSTPYRLQPIYYSCVYAILLAQPSPASLTIPHSHRRLPPCDSSHIQKLNTRARSMMIDANIPIAFRAEMINTASYLQRRSPTIALEGRTPYKVLYQAIQGTSTNRSNHPTLHHLQHIGCVAYYRIPDEKFRNKTALKFGPRST